MKVPAPDMPSSHRSPDEASALPHRLDSVTRQQQLLERLQRAERPVGDRDKLRDRLTRLEPGHPSSPWDERGVPRPLAPRLADVERPRPPLNDFEYAAHRGEVGAALREAHAVYKAFRERQTVNPDRDIWTADRVARQVEIVRGLFTEAAAAPCERKAIIAGGLGGSGKTTVLAEHAGVDLSRYLIINPDRCKEEMARGGMLPDIERLSPMEASGLAHEESSYIAKRLALRAYAEGKNVIWDITMSRPESAAERISELRAAGYGRIEGVFVDIPIEASVARSEARHRRGHDQYLAGEGLGGRYPPPELIRSQADEEHGSINRRAFEEAKPLMDAWVIFDNSVDDRPPIVIERSSDDPEMIRPE